MLNRLYIDNMFVHQDRTFSFEKGLTGIIGRNETGKSLVVEAVRYALFGSKALRGTADDYKKLHVELDFLIGDREFTVVRKGTKATLEGDDQKVTGTKPVNEAIIRILGYDLTVFDVANVCNQGDVERLSEMRPAERKAMVDQTVGLTDLDNVIKYCGDRGNGVRREALAFESALNKPEEPQKPEGYSPSENWPIAEAEMLKDEYLELRGAIKNAPEKPKKPAKCKVTISLAELKDDQKRREVLLKSIENTDRQIKGLEMPEHTREDLEDMLSDHILADRWDEKKRLLDQGELECPSCGHTWPVAADDLKDYSEVEEIARPKLTRRQISDQMELLQNEEKKDSLLAKVVEYEKELAKLPDVTEQIRVRRDHEAEVEVYESRLAAYNKYADGIDEKKARFEEIQGAPEEYQKCKAGYDDAVAYERELNRYEKQLEVYEKNVAAYDDMIAKSEAFLESRKSVQDLKVRIKTHLLPSLNKVASVLLNQMTGGERTKVEVNEDFEILIDGQPVNTLSGSAKAVANLSVRIALGQILTNRVFSVFLADEIDAAMDDERAEYTAGCLRRLTNTVGQVIQVTHKRPETDQTIELQK